MFRVERFRFSGLLHAEGLGFRLLGFRGLGIQVEAPVTYSKLSMKYAVGCVWLL